MAALHDLRERSPLPGQVWRQAVAGPDPAAELERLRLLETAMIGWRCGRLTRWARGEVAAEPARPDLGLLARALARWLEDHPERGNEPLTWIVREVLDALYGGVP